MIDVSWQDYNSQHAWDKNWHQFCFESFIIPEYLFLWEVYAPSLSPVIPACPNLNQRAPFKLDFHQHEKCRYNPFFLLPIRLPIDSMLYIPTYTSPYSQIHQASKHLSSCFCHKRTVFWLDCNFALSFAASILDYYTRRHKHAVDQTKIISRVVLNIPIL